MKILILILFILWIYLLTVLHRAKLPFYKFLCGSVGMFLFMMVILQPIITVPLQKAVAASGGVIGELTGVFYSYYQYSLIFVKSSASSISLYIDYECSGVIEIMAFTALLWFFPLYNTVEKAVVNIVGVLWIFASNIIRITLICVIVYIFGNDAFFFAHTIFGRIVFYGLTVILYFQVFTRSQILRQKVGKFNYVKSAEHTS